MSVSFIELMSPADKIELEIMTKEGKALNFKTEVVEVHNENKLEILAPIKKGSIYPVNTGTRVSIFYSKSDNGVYAFLGLVVKRGEKQNIHTLEILRVSELQKTQRREYFRLPILLDVQLKMPVGVIIEKVIINGSIEEEEVVEYKEMPGIMKDISGGGLRVQIKELIELGTTMIVLFSLNGKSYKVEGTVVRCLLTDEITHAYELGVLFDELDEVLRSKIVSFIFEKQRSLRKKGLI